MDKFNKSSTKLVTKNYKTSFKEIEEHLDKWKNSPGLKDRSLPKRRKTHRPFCSIMQNIFKSTLLQLHIHILV